MPLATMRQMTEIGEMKTNFDDKEWSALQNFKLLLKISTLTMTIIVKEILFLCGIITNRRDS